MAWIAPVASGLLGMFGSNKQAKQQQKAVENQQNTAQQLLAQQLAAAMQRQFPGGPPQTPFSAQGNAIQGPPNIGASGGQFGGGIMGNAGQFSQAPTPFQAPQQPPNMQALLAMLGPLLQQHQEPPPGSMPRTPPFVGGQQRFGGRFPL